MTPTLATAAPLPLPAPESDWREWVTYGLSWAAASPVAEQASPAEVDDGRFMTVHAYRETDTRAPLAGAVRRDLACLPQLVHPRRAGRAAIAVGMSRCARPVHARTDPDLGAALPPQRR